MQKRRIKAKVADLVLNEGQLGWLPRNPRQWTRDDINRTKQSLERDPDFQEDKPILVTPYGKMLLVFAGNLRTTAAKEMKLPTFEAIHYVPESDEDRETIKRRAMLDNGSFGSWDTDVLANEWDECPLADWGVPEWVTDVQDDEDNEEGGSPEKDDKVEALLRDAMRENVTEAFAQINHMMKKGWIAQFLTAGAVKAQFLRAKYYGKQYPQYLSLYFCPQRFMTSAREISMYDQMRKCSEGVEAGIAGFRTISEDGPLNVIQKAGYPIGSARVPVDFPAVKARELIEEFGGVGCSVLDPCHGWGGAACRCTYGRRVPILRC